MTKIIHVRGLEIMDSRGNPTVEANVTLASGHTGRGLVPSGASTGTHEALELRDGDKARYLGKGTTKAVNNINGTISAAIVGKEFSSFRELDSALLALDATANKSNLGANAILAVSMAYIDACAKEAGKAIYEYLSDGQGYVLPIPYMNIINGGEHADNGLDFQEFMIIPQGAPSFSEALRMGAEVFHTLKKILKSQGLATGVGDEGGYAPDLSSNTIALDTVVKAIGDAGYTTEQIKIGLDVASSEFFKEGKYEISGEGKSLTSEEMAEYYMDLISRYPIVSIEDGFAEDDFAGRAHFQKLLEEKGLASQVRTVGDDLYVTNVQRLQMGIDQHLSNAILIKLNQIGSVSETLDTIALAQKNHLSCIISHRSGETEDTFIADLAVAVNAGYIKTGSLSRTDRIAKYNQLLRIERALGNKAQYGKR